MATTRPHSTPQIPDHEVLRQIGGGAYGEIWLARGVTGALRAVKVVWRADFDDQRGFEREFEGILKYEPVSRDHPGLVDILHVGRSPDQESFYYYVMELGDDIGSEREFNPIEYEARTLRTDMKQGGGQRISTEDCLKVGLRLAEALKHLHDCGLAHRDVKPSNVIFVGGLAKLADIGLVATHGQRTFVGTEGFVPPEGPGTAESDVYALGKVIYEMATGKDRLDFPELPDTIPEGAERRRWLALNQLLCEVCEPQVARRGVRTAGELADALAKLDAGKRHRSRRPIGALLFSLTVGGILMWGGWETYDSGPWGQSEEVASEEKEPEQAAETSPRAATIKVTSTPDGADVLEVVDEDRGLVRVIDRTPTDVLNSYVGERLSLLIQRDGYEPYEVETEVPPSAAEEPLVISAELTTDAPPILEEAWQDHLGLRYRPLGEAHVSLDLIGPESWQQFVAEEMPNADDPGVAVQVMSGGEERTVIAARPKLARHFCDWLVRGGIEAGRLTTDHEAIPQFADEIEMDGVSQPPGERLPFRVLVREVRYARALVRTSPPGAQIYVNGLSRGETEGPLLIDTIAPGKVTLQASLEGYKSETRQLVFAPRETRTLSLKLRENKSVVLGRSWENSLGMRFEPMDGDWMVSVWETRRKDFRAFMMSQAADLPLPILSMPRVATGLKEPELHPVVSVSREEAEEFCRWLTAKERAEERLTPSLEYRLPTDYEWSLLAGIEEVANASPAKRDRLKPRVFYWGRIWPPPEVAGNLADTSTGRVPSRLVPSYNDGFAATAPVGSFSANRLGVYDLCGNAQEWVGDSYSSSFLSDGTGVLRGGDWKSYQEASLYVGARNPQPPDARDETYGFRVVLAKRNDETARTNQFDDTD